MPLARATLGVVTVKLRQRADHAELPDLRTADSYRDTSLLLLGLDLIILVAAVWVIVESVGAMNRARKGEGADDEEFERATASRDRP